MADVKAVESSDVEQPEVIGKHTQEKKVSGKCPWCEKRKPLIDAEIKSLQPILEVEEKRLKELKAKLESENKPTIGLTNMYALDSRELQAEKERVAGYKLIMVGSTAQCTGCGKHWQSSALGKPYSIELERGDAWKNEQERKRLRGDNVS